MPQRFSRLLKTLTKEEIKIYRRYNSSQSQKPQTKNIQNTNITQKNAVRPSSEPQMHSVPPAKNSNSAPPKKVPINSHTQSQNQHQQKKPPTSPKASKILHHFLPTSIYNPKTQKILGILSSEDLLLIALIFLFMENDESDNQLIVLALIYVLLSDFIDLSNFSF